MGMFKKLLPYLVSFLIGAAITITIISVNNIYAQTNTQVILQILSDGFFVPGVLLAGVGLLIFASNGGVFDMLAYAVILFFDLFRKDVNKRKYKDFYSYREEKKEKKRPLAFLLIVGLAFLAVALVITIVYTTRY